MLDRNTFTETLRGVSEIIRTSGKPLTKEEILGYFKDMELDAEQEELVFNYLLTPHEDEEEEAESTEESSGSDERPLGKAGNDDALESKVYKMYLDDIESLKTCSDDELRFQYVKLLSGDEKAVDVILHGWLKRTVEIAGKFLTGSLNPEDAVQEGNMALFIKLKELCGSRKSVDVDKELEEAVSDAVRNYIFEVTGEVDGEEAVAGRVNLVNEAVKYLEDKNGVTPDINAIAEFTHIGIDELRDIMSIIDKAQG